jgi:hypothetical protein
MPVYYPTEDTHLNIARGLVKSSSVRNIFGYNANVGLSFVPCWENNADYVFPTSNTEMGIKSTNGADNPTIRVIGLDSNYEEVAENITLNGTANTTLANEYFRINDVVTVAGQANGNVEIRGDSTLYAKIRAGEGRNQASIYTVPKDHCFYLLRIDALSATALSNKYVTFRNLSRFPSAIDGELVELRVAEATFVGQMSIDRQLPFKYNEKTDVVFQAKSSSQTNEVGIFGEGILIKEPLDAS